MSEPAFQELKSARTMERWEPPFQHDPAQQSVKQSVQKTIGAEIANNATNGQ